MFFSYRLIKYIISADCFHSSATEIYLSMISVLLICVETIKATIILARSGIINGITQAEIDAARPKCIGLNCQNQIVPKMKQAISPRTIPIPK